MSLTEETKNKLILELTNEMTNVRSALLSMEGKLNKLRDTKVEVGYETYVKTLSGFKLSLSIILKDIGSSNSLSECIGIYAKENNVGFISTNVDTPSEINLIVSTLIKNGEFIYDTKNECKDTYQVYLVPKVNTLITNPTEKVIENKKLPPRELFTLTESKDVVCIGNVNATKDNFSFIQNKYRKIFNTKLNNVLSNFIKSKINDGLDRSSTSKIYILKSYLNEITT
jgi:hypothetical protein